LQIFETMQFILLNGCRKALCCAQRNKMHHSNFFCNIRMLITVEGFARKVVAKTLAAFYSAEDIIFWTSCNSRFVKWFHLFLKPLLRRYEFHSFVAKTPLS
ncbi:hypothetical protein B7486_69845, partial [cyanobacterium TDX16]